MMKQTVRMLSLLVPLLMMIGCSFSNNWSYQYKGSSTNWQAVVEIVPNEQYGAVFVGKLENLPDKKISHIHYEADVTNTSQRAGNIENPSFDRNFIKLFQDIPNTEQNQEEFKNGVNVEKIKSFFGNYPIFHITWKDEQGEHTETLKLKFVEG